ncbi:MAG: 30S ribosomal protein S16 [Opitutales bacterium]
MALKIRLQRHGASHRPFYRMVVTEAAARRDGRFVEVLGTYEPQASKPENELLLKLERIDYWKSVGAKPTDTAASLIRQARRGPVTSAPKRSKAEENAAVETAATPATEEEAPAAEAEAPAGSDCESGTTQEANGECDASNAKKDEPAAEVTEDQADAEEAKS